MKRIFCTVCGRVRRMRRWPSNVDLIEDGPREVRVAERQSQCYRHFGNGTTAQTLSRVKVLRVTVKTHKTAPPKAAPKPKQRGR